jgi:hypothetical protein
MSSSPSIWTLQIGDLESIGFWIPIILTAIVGALISLYFYRKTRRFKRPAFAVGTQNLIRDYSTKLSGLKIEYKGKNPSTISVSKLAIWNEGTETIDRADIAPGDPLRIYCLEGEILESSVVDVTSPANQFGVQPAGPAALYVAFEYLDKNQGAIVQIVHTSTSPTPVFVVGSVKGSEPIVSRGFEPNAKLSRISGWAMAAAVIALFGFVIQYSSYGVQASIPFIGASSMLFVLSLIVSSIAVRITTVPKRFESVREII